MHRIIFLWFGMSGSNFRQDATVLTEGLRVFPSVLPGKFRDGNLNKALTATTYILFNSLFSINKSLIIT
jgi:hypothetical protein